MIEGDRENVCRGNDRGPRQGQLRIPALKGCVALGGRKNPRAWPPCWTPVGATVPTNRRIHQVDPTNPTNRVAIGSVMAFHECCHFCIQVRMETALEQPDIHEHRDETAKVPANRRRPCLWCGQAQYRRRSAVRRAVAFIRDCHLAMETGVEPGRGHSRQGSSEHGYYVAPRDDSAKYHRRISSRIPGRPDQPSAIARGSCGARTRNLWNAACEAG
jgi:hypothetical protein